MIYKERQVSDKEKVSRDMMEVPLVLTLIFRIIFSSNQKKKTIWPSLLKVSVEVQTESVNRCGGRT